DRHAVWTLAAAALGSGDGNASFLQAIHFLQQNVGVDGPGAGGRIFRHILRPVGAGGDAGLDGSDQLEVSAVVKPNHGHLGNAIAVRTTEVGSHAHVSKVLA